MKISSLILIPSLAVSTSWVCAASIPVLNLSNSSTTNDVAITLQTNNIKTVSDLNFNGLKGIQIIGRQVALNSTTKDSKSNKYTSKLYLLPAKSGSYTLTASANLDGRKTMSNSLTLTVTDAQLTAMKSNLQKEARQENQQLGQVQKQITQQMRDQQKFFDNINTVMQKEQQAALGAN
jgi:hypothetical protein